MAKTTVRAGGEYVASLLTRCGCTKVLKMTGANPPPRIRIPMVSRMSQLVDPNGAALTTTGDVRTFVLNEGAQEECFGMPAFQYLEELP